jgi:UDP-N-acetyl-D-mannosaminuronic acid dehydrogenase
MSLKTICVVGLGYIGLPTAAMLASRKKRVIGVDINARAVEIINSGKIHITEPDLDAVVKAVVSSGNLRATTVPEPADAFMIAVPTPFDAEKNPDLSFIRAAAKSIAPVLAKGNLVVLESTSPVGTTEQLVEWLAEERPDLTFPRRDGGHSDVCVAYCPERVLPGQVMRELIENDRVIGGITPQCTALATELYSSFVKGGCVASDARTAEMAKLTENSFRDVNIAFANELSLICSRLDIDVWELIRLANRHPRVNILRPGPGVGGHCIAVDPWFIVSSAPQEARIIRIAREVNDQKPHWVLERINAVATGFEVAAGRRPRIACYGIAFKPNIDDLRESPALEITQTLCTARPGDVMVVEPHITELPAALAGGELVPVKTARAEADLHVILVAHKTFTHYDWASKGQASVLDFCGLMAY